ncbi:15071_t:CDS:2 [Funneliformis geosporum]|nr:15071_t:CDS:2 [Funneliformis geosporum]
MAKHFVYNEGYILEIFYGNPYEFILVAANPFKLDDYHFI